MSTAAQSACTGGAQQARLVTESEIYGHMYLKGCLLRHASSGWAVTGSVHWLPKLLNEILLISVLI